MKVNTFKRRSYGIHKECLATKPRAVIKICLRFKVMKDSCSPSDAKIHKVHEGRAAPLIFVRLGFQAHGPLCGFERSVNIPVIGFLKPIWEPGYSTVLVGPEDTVNIGIAVPLVYGNVRHHSNTISF